MRATRRLLAAAAVAAAVLVPPPQASAVTVATDVFVASMTLGAGLSFPLVGGIPTVPPAQHCNLPLPFPDPIPQCHLHWGGNTRAVTAVGSTLCVSAGATVGKPGKQPGAAGTCAIATAAGKAPEGNHVHGFCGLNGGQTQGSRQGPDGQWYRVDLHWNGPYFTGHWYKGGQSGLLIGWVLAIPVPAVTGTTLGNSCAAGTATTFTLVGSWILLPV